ncbi:DUF4290 domain-containing protein [Schleiferia thermophila]|jgi:hypothetical protein|uniref:Uncharacterized protein DUF4290 n=3 Tax=Schleiferia thermophila TaxID=884107 RepID=A0A369A3L3_9FLAO|nr:DUF4290 domain-containing protein [Schleiferia thermophila]KFD38941.1 hypothetical protein AT05_07775 [Schleiferia thermophila str. Yellowstone]RCX03753.1 uncharacterized protein DUF4290 [Schleiferia thermophila]GCD79987.1 hypothetical protein JCM30197_12340 [Schleiferia thermophila]
MSDTKSLTYNTSKDPLRIPEYGRVVHEMIRHTLSLPDREQRSKAARAIIEVIGNLNPQLRDQPDFRHKLWDHLFIMSDFQLDVDAPYPIPTREQLTEPPRRLQYPQKTHRHRYYGSIIRQMIKKASDMPEGEEKIQYIRLIANQMKKTYLQWNKDTVEDQVIIDDLVELSNGKLQISDLTLTSSSTLKKLTTPTNQSGKKKNGYKKNQKAYGKHKKNFKK